MLNRSLVIAILAGSPLLAFADCAPHKSSPGTSSIGAQGAHAVYPEDRVVGADAEIGVPSTTRAFAESLTPIARAAGVVVGFKTVLDPHDVVSTQFGWWARGQTVG